ncbi:MAG: prepilin-type N-terminal cleavage/methylation domain-containing protein [Candidatus Peregrinibacteria bacterium]
MVKNKNNKGFTMIELVVYVAVAAFILVGIVRFNWDIMGVGVKLNVSGELTQNSRLVLERITYKIQNAEALAVASSTFGVHPGVLTVTASGANSIIDTYTKNVSIGGQTISIRKLRMKEGAAAAIDLTSDKVNVTHFVLTNLTRDEEPANVKMELTLEYVETGEDPLRNESLSVQTAASLRQ